MRDARWLLPALIGAAIAIRTAWLFFRSGGVEDFEARNVAVALASGRGFSDAFFLGSGPTAHLMPSSPAIAGMVFSLFGIDTPASLFVLAAIAMAEMSLCYILVFRLFRKLHISREACLTAVAILCLVPVYIFVEGLMFQYWELGIAMIFALLCLHDMVDNSVKGRVGFKGLLKSALLASVTFFISPTIGVSVLLGYAFLTLKYRPWINTVTAGLLTVLCMTALFIPWTIRNYHALGVPIIMRDNAGLELALANNPAALTTASPFLTFSQRMFEIHPVMAGPGRAEMKKLGEVNYARHLGELTRAWIIAHPRDFAKLSLTHFRDMYFPQFWQVGETARFPRVWIIRSVNALGLISLGIALWRRQKNWIYPALFILGLGLCYTPFQPTSRYMYPIYCLLIFCACDLLWQTGKKWIGERQPGPASA